MARLWAAVITVKDFMAIHFVEIAIKGRMTIITGQPDAGKSSIIHALWRLFQGKAADPAMPIRKGATGYEITVKVEGDRTFTAKQTENRLSVEDSNGTRWTNQFEMLRAITNEFMQNPIEFARLGRRESSRDDKRRQVELLQAALKMDIDPKAIDAENEQSAKRRTELGRESDRLKGEIATITVQEGLPGQRPDLDAIRARLAAAEEEYHGITGRIEARNRIKAALAQAEINENRNEEFCGQQLLILEHLLAEIEALPTAIQDVGEIRDSLEQLREKAGTLPELPGERDAPLVNLISDARVRTLGYIDHATDRLDGLKRSLEGERRKLKAAEAQRQPLAEAMAAAQILLEETPEPVAPDIRTPRLELEDALLIHREMDRKDRSDALKKKKEELDTEIRALKRGEEQRDEQRRAAIRNAKMPLEGLSFDNGGSQILFDSGNGSGPIPLSQHGEATQLKVSIAVGLAADPDLRLVMIPNGEAFNDQRLAELADMAEEMDFQVIMAKVDDSGKLGIVMEQGSMKAENELPVPLRKERRKKPTDQTLKTN